MISLTESQQDTITELLNIGIGRAAASLSEMVGEEIELSVPAVELLSRQTTTIRVKEKSSDRIVAVQQQFSGSFGGDTMLIFPEAKSLELVRCIMQDNLPLEVMTEMEQEALLEIGNIVLNACLGSIANMLQCEVSSSLPSLLRGTCEDIIGAPSRTPAEQEVVMFLRMDFALRQQSIYGCVMFVIDGNAITAIQQSLEQFLGHLT